MAEEPIVEEVVVPSEDSNPEVEQPVVDDVKEEPTEEVDEKGVPIKNRVAEAERKARKMSMAQAETALLKGDVEPAPATDQEEAIRLVKDLARQEAKALYEPILAKQFLIENPDAAEMIEDINRIRTDHPELAGIDKLEIAYKVAKAERQDELIRRKTEAELSRKQETIDQSKQAAVEGTGKSRSPQVTVQDRIAEAKSLKELQELENLLQP